MKSLIIFFIIVIQYTYSNSIKVYSSHSMETLYPLIKEFESNYDCKIEIEVGGTGELVNKVLKEQNQDYPDVFFGGTTLSVAPLNHIIKESHSFSIIPNVLLVNKNIKKDVIIKGYKDLLNPELKGKIAYSNPKISSSSFEHLVNILYVMKNPWDYIKDLSKNIDYIYLNSSQEVIERVVSGKSVVGLTHEVAAIKALEKNSNLEIIYMEEGVLAQNDGIYILNKNSCTENLTEFLTSYDTQLFSNLLLNRRSIRDDIFFNKKLNVLKNTIFIDSNKFEIVKNRSLWIEKFENISKEISNDSK